MHSNILLVLPLMLLPLVACNTTQSIEVTAKPVELNIIQPVDPQPVDMLKVNVKVLTKENVDAFIKQAQKDLGTDNPVFVALSTRDYEALSLNIQELKRYILQQQKIIAYYKKATAAHDVANTITPPAK
jgi:hypothetical protein